MSWFNFRGKENDFWEIVLSACSIGSLSIRDQKTSPAVRLPKSSSVGLAFSLRRGEKYLRWRWMILEALVCNNSKKITVLII